MTTVVTPSTDSGPGTALAVVLSLIAIAVVGFMIYAFSGGTSSTVIERNTTIEKPAVTPVLPEAPKAPELPTAPAE
jgi:hypothetical protein